MQITVTIPDEFAAQIQALGQSPEAYIENLIAEQTAELQAFDPRQALTVEELDASLDALTRYSEEIPSLPIEAFSSESFYENHN